MRDSMNQNCTLFKKEISSGDMMIYDHLGTWWVFFDFMSWQNELEDKEEEEEEGSLGLPGCFIFFSGEGVSERRNLWLCCLERSWRGLEDLDLEWSIGAGETKDVLRGCSNSSKLLTSSWTWLGGVRERETCVVDDPVVSHLRQLLWWSWSKYLFLA